MSAAGNIFGVLGGCMGCMVFVESIAKQKPDSMNLMTFSTFFFIALHGLIFTSRFFTVRNKIPLRGYVPVVVTFFLVNVINNQALNFHVPVPLHIIFRSGSLLANLVLTVLLQGKSYSLRKYVSVLAITFGIILCTLATSGQDNSEMSMEEASKHYKEWMIGIFMLTFALIASAYLAICQQRMYEQYGKHPEEALFITHIASLPLFLFMWSDITRAAGVFTQSAPVELLGMTIPIPSLWAELAVSDVLQFMCISFVYKLNASVEALTVTLVVTLRKFLSLLFSIFYFQNPFTPQHWMGTFFVFAGTLAFADVWFQSNKKKEEKKLKKTQ